MCLKVKGLWRSYIYLSSLLSRCKDKFTLREHYISLRDLVQFWYNRLDSPNFQYHIGEKTFKPNLHCLLSNFFEPSHFPVMQLLQKPSMIHNFLGFLQMLQLFRLSNQIMLVEGDFEDFCYGWPKFLKPSVDFW